MKNLKYLFIAFITSFSIVSCIKEDDLEFVAKPQGDFVLTNSFLSNYVLPAENNTDGNIGVLFAWDAYDFGVPTNISYQLQYSLIGDFTDAVVYEDAGSTSENVLTLTIGQLKEIAEEYGYAAPDTGEMHFRVRAYPGQSGTTTEKFSNVQTINVELLEPTQAGSGIEISPWGVVGSGYNDWGNNGPDGLFYTTSQNNVIVSYVTLIDGQIKFRQNNTWSGDLGDSDLDGFLDTNANNNIAVTAGDYKITINLSDNSYTIVPFSWGVVGSAYNDWGNGGPDAKFYYDYTTDTFKASMKLLDGQIKVRPNNTWSGDLGDSNADGILDNGANNNINVTAGHYTMTINLNNNAYTLTPDTVWGVVGSGYNDWGNGGPDFALTHLTENVYVGELATLIDGQIKFRPNNEWNGDKGDANLDGILDSDANNNINVTAGKYRVKIDFSTGAYTLRKVM